MSLRGRSTLCQCRNNSHEYRDHCALHVSTLPSLEDWKEWIVLVQQHGKRAQGCAFNARKFECLFQPPYFIQD